MAIDAPSTSRFSQTEAVLRNGKETFGRWKQPDFTNLDLLEDEDIIRFSVDASTAGRPDKIAVDQYGSQLLEWVVVMSNKPMNPINWPPVGAVIRLPSPSIVLNNV